jgi:hypothetical protein
MDSLLNRIYSNEFIKRDTVEYEFESFIRYESLDNHKSYDLFLDSSGVLVENIGLAMIFSEYDNEHRKTKRIGLNLEGQYTLWDYSPIVHTRYSGDTTIADHFNHNYKLKYREISIKDSLNREIETWSFDGELKLIKRVVNRFNDELNELRIMNCDEDGKFLPNTFGVLVEYRKFDSIVQNQVLEKLYFDSSMHLVDADHEHIGNNYFVVEYSQIKYEMDKDGFLNATYLNTHGELVCKENVYTGEFEIIEIISH